jgi:hypothetical protein
MWLSPAKTTERRSEIEHRSDIDNSSNVKVSQKLRLHVHCVFYPDSSRDRASQT